MTEIRITIDQVVMDEINELIQLKVQGNITAEELNASVNEIDRNYHKRCALYKLPLFLDNPEMKSLCHDVCDGYGSGCDFAMYSPKPSCE